ncbi:NAD kinase domain-containing protein 1-like protein, partial [Leptotrombidium deliense]
LNKRGSCYKSLLHHHNIHSQNRDNVIRELRNDGIEVKIVNRFEYTKECIDWADLIVTTGGDGTYLMAASKVLSRNKPVIGVNSDPSRSIGYLCLPPNYTSNFKEALKKLKNGEFEWTYRQRIKVTLHSEDAMDDPIELHNQMLLHPEYRYLDLESTQMNRIDESDHEDESVGVKTRVLPVRALNEVFVGECLSSRVSYYEFAIDKAPRTKLKSSGMTICTGTGSTSWSLNINKVSPGAVKTLFDIIKEETHCDLPHDPSIIQRVSQRFNNSLIFDSSRPVMAYTVRDPILMGTETTANTRGWAQNIEVRSRMFDACVVIDGGLSYKFNDGAIAEFTICEEDALKTVSLK